MAANLNNQPAATQTMHSAYSPIPLCGEKVYMGSGFSFQDKMWFKNISPDNPALMKTRNP
jgi:hypothetical protein